MRIYSPCRKRGDVSTLLFGVSLLKTSKKSSARYLHKLVKVKCGLAGQCEASKSLRNWVSLHSLAGSFSKNLPRCLKNRSQRALRTDPLRQRPWKEEQQPCRRNKNLHLIHFPHLPQGEKKSLTLWGKGQQTFLPLRTLVETHCNWEKETEKKIKALLLQDGQKYVPDQKYVRGEAKDLRQPYPRTQYQRQRLKQNSRRYPPCNSHITKQISSSNQ